jgi:hypothetical protein
MHKDAAEFVGVLLHSATATHFLHLQTASYAAHKALGHYYENIVVLADKFAEAYQGHYGIIPLADRCGQIRRQPADLCERHPQRPAQRHRPPEHH